MARIRTIKPNHVNDKSLTKISLQAHLFWVLSWCFSDDEGVMDHDLFLLRSQIFPRRTDIRIEQIQQWLDQLVKARFVIPFTHQGEGYLLHRTFHIHQKIDRKNVSKIPLELLDTLRRTFDDGSMIEQPCIGEESIVEERRDFVPTAPPTPSPDELEFKEVQNWIKENAPEVGRMKDPLTLPQYIKLKNRYGPEFVSDILLKMHNWKDLNKKRTSAYLTFLNSFASKEKV